MKCFIKGICPNGVLFLLRQKTRKDVIIIEFSVEIIETLAKTICVQAESLENAIEEAERLYRAGEYVLDADNFIGVEFKQKAD